MASMHVAKMQKETLIHSANAMNQHGLVTNAANFGFERLLLVLHSFWQILLFYFENRSKQVSTNTGPRSAARFVHPSAIISSNFLTEPKPF